MIRATTLVMLAAALVAADPAPAPTAAAVPAPAATKPANRAFLGVTLADASGLDAGAQVTVASVLPDSTFAQLGVQPGDIIDRLDDTPVRTVAEFGTATAALHVGAGLRVTLRRAGQERVVSGTIAALPRPRDLATNAEQLTSEIAKVSAAVERERMRADLAETLRLLTAFQEGLPRVAEEFKKVYPKGTFKVRIDIDISSDPDAKEQTALVPAPAGDAPPAAPASGGEGPGPKPAVP